VPIRVGRWRRSEAVDREGARTRVGARLGPGQNAARDEPVAVVVAHREHPVGACLMRAPEEDLADRAVALLAVLGADVARVRVGHALLGVGAARRGGGRAALGRFAPTWARAAARGGRAGGRAF